ncbi:kelch motif family protein, putative, partial [Ichthyophthirius multifiliis]
NFQWKRLKRHDLINFQNQRFGHSINSYGKNLIIFGGETISINKSFISKQLLSDVFVYNLENQNWKAMLCTGGFIQPRRNHTAALIGRSLIIHGGINNREQVLKDLWILDIGNQSWLEVILQTDFDLCFHKCAAVYHGQRCGKINLYKMQEIKFTKLGANIKYEGIYFFGGKNSKGEISGDLKILKTDSKPFQWIKPETYGQSPSPRYSHSMDFCQEINFLVIHGGQNDNIAHNMVGLSDGFSEVKKAYIIGEAADRCEELQQFTIIKCKKYKEQSQTERLIIQSYQIIYTNIDTMIGKPLEHKQFKKQNFINHEGSNIIPTKYYNEEEGDLLTIAELYPNIEQFKFKARVTKKGTKRNFTTKKGTNSYLFGIDIIDINQDEMSITFFEQEVDRFIDIIEQGHTYIFQIGKIQSNDNNQYKKGKIQMTASRDTQIMAIDEDKRITQLKIERKMLSDIQQLSKNDKIDVICLVNKEERKIITLKTGEQRPKKEIFIFDESGVEVEFDIWGDEGDQMTYNKGDILLIKDGKVGEYNGNKFLQWSSFMTQIITNPDPQSFKDAKLNNQLDENLKIWTEIRAFILRVKDTPLYYNACPKCLKKIREEGDSWYCQSCLENRSEPQARYISSICIGDASGQIWVNAYDEVAREILGCSADEFRILDKNNDIETENMADGIREKTIIQKIKEFNPINESKKFLNMIDKYQEFE